MNVVNQIKSRWINKSIEDLINFVYHNFIAYTTKSKIKDKIFANSEFDPELLELVGIIPIIPLEDEKEYIKKVLVEKYL